MVYFTKLFPMAQQASWASRVLHCSMCVLYPKNASCHKFTLLISRRMEARGPSECLRIEKNLTWSDLWNGEFLEMGKMSAMVNICLELSFLHSALVSLCLNLLKAPYGCDHFPLRSKGKLGTQSSLIASQRTHCLIQKCLRLENQTSPDNFGNFRELCFSTQQERHLLSLEAKIYNECQYEISLGMPWTFIVSQEIKIFSDTHNSRQWFWVQYPWL